MTARRSTPKESRAAAENGDNTLLSIHNLHTQFFTEGGVVRAVDGIDFSVRRGRETVQKGTHRIGWDAQARRIRGWVFDSQGGFGETSWEEVDGAWIVKSTGVGPDGVTRSGTRVMTPGGDRIDVRLTDRIAEGQRLPDIEFTMVRKPPKPVAASSAKPAAEGVK